MPYTATFINRFPKSITLEVVSGNNQSCDVNANMKPPLFNGLLNANGGQATVATDDPVVCYRRTQDYDNPGGGLGLWNQLFLDDNNPNQTIDPL